MARAVEVFKDNAVEMRRLQNATGGGAPARGAGESEAALANMADTIETETGDRVGAGRQAHRRR